MMGAIIARLRQVENTEQYSNFTSDEIDNLIIIPDSGIKQIDVADGKINIATRSKLAASVKGITPSAAKAILAEANLYGALSVAFQDKGVKARLRLLAQTLNKKEHVRLFLQQAADLKDGVSPVVPRPPLGPLVPKITNKNSSALPIASNQTKLGIEKKSHDTDNGSAESKPTPRLVTECIGLERFEEESLAVRIDKDVHKIRFYQAIELLDDKNASKMHGAILQSLSVSSARLAILILDRAVRARGLDLGEELEGKLRISAVRLLTNLNANETAHTLASDLLESKSRVSLPDSELLRLQFGLARSKLRTGRAEQAAAMYRQIFLENPDRPDAAMQYITSIFGSKPEIAATMSAAIVDMNRKLSPSDRVFLGELCLKANDRIRATRSFIDVVSGPSLAEEGFVGLANAALKGSEHDEWFAYLQRYGELTGLHIASVDSDAKFAPFGFSTSEYKRTAHHPKIAVVMTSFNAANTIGGAIESVLSQTLTNIELWVVDDVSTDDSVKIAKRYAEADSRVRVLENSVNCGTYASKNTALRQTDAEYVTLHDSDDWMHPKKLEVQFHAIDGKACTTSNWLRMDMSGEVFVRRGGPYTHLNPASTFMPKSLLEDIGYFDEVRTGADAEFLTRLRVGCGWANVFNCGQTLAIGLHHEASLTNSGATAFDEHRYSPLRLAYTESWIEWQLAQIEQGEDVAIAPHSRPFPIPTELSPTRD